MRCRTDGRDWRQALKVYSRLAVKDFGRKGGKQMRWSAMNTESRTGAGRGQRPCVAAKYVTSQISGLRTAEEAGHRPKEGRTEKVFIKVTET